MQKKMLELIVSTDEGQIYVEGPEYSNDAGEPLRPYISVAPEQVDTLNQWMLEAKAELLKEHDMQKKMVEFIVSTGEGLIYVEGPEFTNDAGEPVRDYISVWPDQVDFLIQWLLEAKAELLASK
jgi:hypothetical protein